MKIEKPRSRRVLAVFFVFLSLSFIASIFLMRWHDNFFTKWFYIFSAFWVGALMNLLAVSLLLWIAVFLFAIFKRKFDYRRIAAVIFSLAAAYSFYGAYRACNPVLTDVEVEIKGLNDEWRGKKIIQLSDVHLGKVHGKRFLEKIINKVDAINPDLILITGDLFDGMGGELEDFIEPLNRLKAEKGIYFTTGNHEYYLGMKKPLNVLSKTKINILYNQIAEVNGLQIIGVSFPLPGIQNNIEEIFKNYKEDEPCILMFHTPTSINDFKNNPMDVQFSSYWRPHTDFSFVKGRGVDLQLSGHSHAGQIFPFNLLARYLYNGYYYGLKKEGDWSVYTSSGVGTWGPPMRIGTKSEIAVIKLK